MTLKDKLTKQLEQLSEIAALGAGPQHVALEHDGRRLECDLEALDRLGCAVTRLSVSSPALAAASLDRLESIGQALAAKLTYLLEPIAVLETDADEQTVQMRSQPPQRHDKQSHYYELLVGRGRLELHRYAKDSGQPRRCVAAHLTREVLQRLAGDLAHAAG
jgi:hypothetical protein